MSEAKSYQGVGGVSCRRGHRLATASVARNGRGSSPSRVDFRGLPHRISIDYVVVINDGDLGLPLN
jgi:hypothetical protein